MHKKVVSPRVMLITSEFPPDIGGISSHVAELARGLASQIASVAVVRPQDIFSELGYPSTQSFAVHMPRIIKGEPLYSLMLNRWLAKTLSRSPVDILHVHGTRPLGATRGLSAPTVFTNHSSGFLARLNASPRRQSRTKHLLKHVSHVIGPSDELVNAVRIFDYSGPATMITNGVDIDRFCPGGSVVRDQLGITHDEVVVLLARRLVEKNGVIWFARALAHMRHAEIRVIIAGDGPERAPMERVLASSDMIGRTYFLGSVPNDAMSAVYRAADLCVLPSLAEATSIAGLEAMASGLPLVGTRVGGIPTIIDDGSTGLLVPAKDPETMAAAIDLLVSDPDMRRRLGAAARQKVEREFAWPIIIRKTISVYQACV